jgi:hypothetical protein
VAFLCFSQTASAPNTH